MNRERPKSVNINIFLPDGSAEGLRIARQFGSTGVALAVSRSQLAAAQALPEFGKPGVYVLIDPSEDVDFPRVYVGEADVLRDRLREHAKKRDQWTKFIAYTTQDGSLNKAHAKNLESELVSLGKRASRAEIENGNLPQAPQLAASELANVQHYLHELLLLFPVLGLSCFEVPPKVAPDTREAKQPELYIDEAGVRAHGREVLGQFLVRTGSDSRPTGVMRQTDSSARLRKELVSAGVIAPAGGGEKFTRDYMFGSASQAAELVLGRAANGRIAWKLVSDKRTLKEFQDDQLRETEKGEEEDEEEGGDFDPKK